MKKVLVVDDSVLWREFLKNVITERGHTVETAEDGLDGYNKAFEFLPDLIFTDVVMPKLNGYHLCRLLKNSKTFKHSGIVIMTTLEESLSRFWAYKSGADGFIQKSSIQEVIPRVEEFLEMDFRTDWKNTGTVPKQPLMELSALLDNLLLKETIKNEIYSLYSFINDENHVLWKLSDLAFDVFSIDALALMVLNPQEGLIFASSKSGVFNSEELKKRLFSFLKKPTVPLSWIFKGNVTGGEGNLNPEDMKVYAISDGEEEIGTLGLLARGMNEDEVEILEELVDNLGKLLKLTTTYSMTLNMARFDELTGLNNYRTLMEKLTEYFSLARRQRFPLSLLMVDIDHFKMVNDTYGHLVGNEVLKKLASIMRESFRSTDILGRYGGEEFTVGLVDAGIEIAREVAERFRKKVERFDWSEIERGLNVTVSIGITSTDIKDYRTVVEMIEDADEALYASKRLGRNRVTVHGEV